MKKMASVLMAAVVVAAMVVTQGCAAFRTSVKDVDVDNAKPMDAKYGFTDLRQKSEEMGDLLLAEDFLAQEPAPPLVVILGIENRTTDHLDTQAMEDTLRRKLMNSKKMRFVNSVRRDDLLREQRYQAENATQETRTQIARQLGAKFMMTGSIIEISKKSGRQVRVSSKEQVYYQLTVEVTDLTTSEILAAPQVDWARQESKPLIGW